MTTLAFLFPGQGSQAAGMGKALFDAEPAARAVFQEADEALGISLSTLCFEGPEAELALTANTQPAILTTSIAALAVIRERTGLRPVVAMGHSLGEFSALVAAGALRFPDAVRLVRLRGQAMQEAVAAGVGAMAAVIGMEEDELSEVCVEAAQGQVCAPANDNGGGQIVVAGHAEAVTRLISLVKARERRAIPLKVSAPFHCALMQPAAQRLRTALAEIEVGPMTIPVVTNVDAEPNDDSSRVAELLVRQVTERVRWEASVRKAVHMGVAAAVEVGHGKVLAGLVKRIAPEVEVRGAASPDDIAVLEAWANGR
ncbi:ACP S-malonyltransferase [Paraliomyxa miuraensis]|uniref:ACP S-malonyltransferase n=1 Tax=Paraliomyxa miuraensis TaxID=376150 RepID=UPI002256C53D|nr:ACP S-malonyltransferase [Paraliomyxa miuraensis]MCX4244661.1 ACP S-malonyltransferase [Paraliomyxa miuraensis]